MHSPWQTVVTQLPAPCALGESPFWHPDELLLYWVDIQAQRIHRCNVFMGSTESWAMPQAVGCIAPVRTAGQASGLVIALRDGIYRATEWGGALHKLADAPYDVATTRFNDGKADPQGRFWAGTLYEPRDASKAQLFCLKGAHNAASALELKADHAIIANGLAWSPDAATLYWADTTRHRIRAWDWNPLTNTLSGERVFKQWPTKPAGWQFDAPHAAAYSGRPDGAAVDTEGNYYVAMFEGARVLKLAPNGDVLLDIAVPAQCPTMPCFGGDDLKTLYLTSASYHRSAAELQAWPDSGRVFSMHVDVPGLPVNFFVD